MLHHRHTRLAIVAAFVALVLATLAMCGQASAQHRAEESGAIGGAPRE